MITQRSDQEIFRPLGRLMARRCNEIDVWNSGQICGLTDSQAVGSAKEAGLGGDAIAGANRSENGAQIAAGEGDVPGLPSTIKGFNGKAPRDATFREGRQWERRAFLGQDLFRPEPFQLFRPQFLAMRFGGSAHTAEQVDFVILQQPGQGRAETYGHGDLKGWMGRAKRAENFRKARQEQVFRYTQSNGAARDAFPEIGKQAALNLQQPLTQRDKSRTVARQLDGLGAAGEQARSKLLLKPADMLTDGGLTDPKRLGRRREVQGFRDRQKRAQMHGIKMCLIFHANM